MEPDAELVRTARPLWVSLGEDGYEITSGGYESRAQVDLTTLEILAVACVPCSPERIATWVGGSSPSLVLRRVSQLLEDGFLTTAPASPDEVVWWQRWGAEARQLHEAGRRVKFLPNDEQAVVYKLELGALPTQLGPAGDRADFVGAVPQRRTTAAEMPIDYWQVIDGRRTVQQHTGQSLPADALHALVSATFAVRELEETVGLGTATRKRFASAGGRHELVVHAADLRTQDAPNVWAYDDIEDRMLPTGRRIERAQVNEATGHQDLADHAAGVVLVMTDLDEASWKYRGPAGYRTALINTGFAGQLLLQNAEALGMAVRLTDSVDQDAWTQLLNLPERLLPILAFTVSRADLQRDVVESDHHVRSEPWTI